MNNLDDLYYHNDGDVQITENINITNQEWTYTIGETVDHINHRIDFIVPRRQFGIPLKNGLGSQFIAQLTHDQ